MRTSCEKSLQNGSVGMNKILWTISGIGVITLLCWGLQRAPLPEERVVKIVNIDRIMLHTTTKYSFLVDGFWQTHGIHDVDQMRVQFLFDVPDDKKDWVEIYQNKLFLGDWKNDYMVIHVHNAGDIYGGDWDHGKFGKGQNVVID